MGEDVCTISPLKHPEYLNVSVNQFKIMNNTPNNLPSLLWRDKFLLIMKLTIVLIFIGVIKVSAGAYSQNVKLSLNVKQVPVEQVFKVIGDQSEFTFFYRTDLVRKLPKVDVDETDATIQEILNKVLIPFDLSYEIYDYTVVVKKKPVQAKYEKTLLQKREDDDILISGVVTDENDGPLPGATILEKGTNNGTVTDLDGTYNLEVSENAILVVSFLGYATKEISVNNASVINVKMDPDISGLDEVVVVGYGTQKKQAITGAVAQADLEVYKNVPTNNVLEMIKGSVPGLVVGGTSTAGELPVVNVRGQNSTAGNDPLIVLDGSIFYGSIADINPNDIESLTILKDASAAAVYGSRSSNGVILIQTKQGYSGGDKPVFEARLTYGRSNELEPLEVYGADEYVKRLGDYLDANSIDYNPNEIELFMEPIERENYLATPDHRPTLKDPYELMRQDAYNVKANLSVSNSSKNTSYYIAGSVTDQKGVYLNDRFKQFSGRVNLDTDLTDWFNLSVKSSYSLRDYSGDTPGGGPDAVGPGANVNTRSATTLSPYASIYDEEGNYLHFPQTSTAVVNPFWTIATDDVHLIKNLNNVLTGRVEAPWVKGLSYTLRFTNNLRWEDRNWFYDNTTHRGENIGGEGRRAYYSRSSMILDNIVKYNNTFSDKHNVDVTLLYSYENSEWEDLVAYARGFSQTVLGTYKLQDGTTQTVQTGGGETNGIGMMARMTYTFDSKYSLTGTVRRDGYSAFSRNKKWGVFPSIGANWNVSKENFMNKVDFIDNLAVRLSYGKNGNQSISPYSTLAKVGTGKYLYGGDSEFTVTQRIGTFANDNLSWETTLGTNLGIDFSVMKNRISGSIDMYKTTTQDLLFSLQLPRISGSGSILANVGEIDNKGIEISLNTLNINNQRFQWRSSFAFSLNRNEVVSILGDDLDGDGKEDDLISSGFFIGEPLGTIYGYQVDGLWQQEDIENGSATIGSRPGDYRIKDLNGDSTITAQFDRKIMGTTQANFQWSLTNSVTLGDFTLMGYLYSIWGGKNMFLSRNNDPYNDDNANKGNINHIVYDYWTPENTDAKFPRMDYRDWAPYKDGVEYLDRSFVKLQKVSLTYNATRVVKKFGIDEVLFTLSADNLFTYAPHWVGLDPETDSGLTEDSLPSMRTYMVGLNFKF